MPFEWHFSTVEIARALESGSLEFDFPHLLGRQLTQTPIVFISCSLEYG